MTDVEYERVAREFLAWALDYEDRHWRDSQRRSAIYPGASWPFFGACWDECVRRGWIVGAETVDEIEQVAWIYSDNGERYDEDGDPRVALPACIIQWLDAQGGTHD